MRIIERLLDRAKNRPRPDLLGIVSPWGDKWHFMIHRTTGRGRKKQCETEIKAFDFKADAVKYAESVMKGNGQILTVSFIDMDKRETPFTPAEKEAAGIATD